MITRNTGARFSFDDRYCYMQDGTIIGEYFPATLYQFIFSPIIPANYSLIANNLNMHSRLGHPSGRVMRELGYSPSSEFKICEHCSAGKMTKVSPKSSTFKAIHPLRLIHSDVCGPINVPGLSGERYFLTIVDDFSRWCSILPLATKSAASSVIKQFINFSETQFSSKRYKIGILRTDNGTEFCNNDLKHYLQDKSTICVSN